MLGVGMALPGPFGVESMSFVGPTTMAGWEDVAHPGAPGRSRPACRRSSKPTWRPPRSASSSTASAREFSEYYYLYFGVGLGGAMVHDGAVMRGAWGNAGEIGHIPAVPDGEPCPCGNRGCLERYLSLDALAPSQG